MRTEPDELATHDARVIPERDDEGKDVVDAHGRDLGMVTTVVGNTMYADPNTTLSEAVERKLGWDDERSTDLPIPARFVTRIDDEVVLAVEREEQYRQEVE